MITYRDNCLFKFCF